MDYKVNKFNTPLSIVTGNPPKPKLELLVSLINLIDKEATSNLKFCPELEKGLSIYKDTFKKLSEFRSEISYATLLNLPPIIMGTIYDQTS